MEEKGDTRSVTSDKTTTTAMYRPLDSDLPMRPDTPAVESRNGQPISLVVNSFPMRMLIDNVILYDVTFEPEIPADASSKRRSIINSLKNEISGTFGTWFYDNTRIWTVNEVGGTTSFDQTAAHVRGRDAGSDEDDDETPLSTVHIRFLKNIDLKVGTPEEQEMIVHIILAKCIKQSKLLRVGRNYFEENQGIEADTNQYVEDPRFPKLCLWRGYSIAVEPTVSGLQLKADISHRVLQYQNVRQLIDNIQSDVKKNRNNRNYSPTELAKEVHSCVMEELKGAAVLTLYNKRVWRIHDIDWNLGTDDEFETDEGETFTYGEYFYKRYGAKTSNAKKGMLIHNPRRKAGDDGSTEKCIILAPELCYLTGLNKKMKANYTFMRQVADKTRLGAAKRHDAGRQLVTRLNQTIINENKLAIFGTDQPVDKRKRRVDRKRRQLHEEKSGIDDELDLTNVDTKDLVMPLQLDPNAVSLKGRILPKVEVHLKNPKDGGKSKVNALNGLQQRWGNSAFFNPSAGPNKNDPVKIKKWAIFYERRNTDRVRDLADKIKLLAKEQLLWGPLLSKKPSLLEVTTKGRTPSTLRWEKCMKKYIEEESPDMVVCLVPSTKDNGDIYSAIKSLCCAESSVLSQCIQEKSLNNPQRMTAIIRNCLKQMITKAGNIPWRVIFDLPGKSIRLNKPSMVVGIDVNHDWKRKKSSVGFVASYDQHFVQYNSFVAFQERGKEIVEAVGDLLRRALKRFRREWNFLPSQIFVFRDGVSNSQLSTVHKMEVGKMRKEIDNAFEKHNEDAEKPMKKKPKLVFIVVQKRVTARFLTQDEQSVPPGTCVDSQVVSSRFWDYYLVTCQAPRQGTATPSRYIVVCDEINMEPDAIQAFTHQLCSLYFNWPGPVRSPAPCMYASKIGYLFGTAMCLKEPSRKLTARPYYL